MGFKINFDKVTEKMHAEGLTLKRRTLPEHKFSKVDVSDKTVEDLSSFGGFEVNFIFSE